MKILLINKFLYARGGDCICTLNLRMLLKNAGHDVRVFTMNYSENLSFCEADYFVEEVSFAAKGIKEKLKAATRIIFGTGVKSNYEKLLDDFQPDVVHLHNIHSYLSPIVAKIAYERGIKVIWTLHDYKLICPAYSCLHKGNVCEACYTSKYKVLTKKCMKDSLLPSALAYAEALWWNKHKIQRWTTAFVCPSKFISDKMIAGGYPAEKMKVICNFIDQAKIELIGSTQNKKREKAYCYIGRLSPEKGIEQLLAAAIALPYPFYVAGNGPQMEELKRKYSANNISFLGHQNPKEIISLLKKVSFSVLPSVCYENNPLSIIESLCCGTPVLGSTIGGIPELLNDEYSRLFPLNDTEALKNKITEMFNTCDSIDNKKLSSLSIERFSDKKYYSDMMDIYK